VLSEQIVSDKPRDPAHTAAAVKKPPDHGPISLGTVLEGKYLVQSVIGRGSMGVVYLGWDQQLERKLAIKVLLPRYSKEERVARRFKLEAVAMAAVREQNVVQIFSYGDYGKHPYFVMEYVPGYTVANLIERANERGEQLYLDVVLGILRQICRGLDAVHRLGIVHRDVKPANMLIGPKFKVMLTDFGLVETIHDDTDRDLAGTPLFLAPELIRRQQLPEDLRFRADIYALGISTYEMLAGDVPFDGSTIKEILRKHLHAEPPPIANWRTDLPDGIEQAIQRALSKNPAKRHESCVEFLTDLENARGQHATAVTRSGPRILIVDDDQETRTVFRTAMRVTFPEATVNTAPDGFQGLELARHGRPDLMFVDMNMPGMNGLELVAAMRGDELLAGIPVVIVSAEIDASCRPILKSLGVEHIMQKPVELTDLINVAKAQINVNNGYGGGRQGHGGGRQGRAGARKGSTME
jgi:CheY-like chemotaxis protein